MLTIVLGRGLSDERVREMGGGEGKQEIFRQEPI